MQPVTPEEQKRQMMVKYQATMKAAKAKFTLKIEKRYMCLMKSVSSFAGNSVGGLSSRWGPRVVK